MRDREAKPAGDTQKKKSPLTNIILVLMLIVGAGIMAYPTVSDYWNSFHQTRAIATYANAVESTSHEEMERILEEAREYNRALLNKESRFKLSEEEEAEYEKLLDVSGNGIMCYIEIPSIKVALPIYHGTSDPVLQVAVGHIEGSSLPVGGEGTHSALSGHRGLPSAKLFSDLDRMKEGDLFTITVLDQVLTYQVDQIRIVEPSDVSDLVIVPGHDYCTLITCTPYGINTHRMLVRGTRIENPEEQLVFVPPDASRIPAALVVPAVGIPLLFLFLLGMLIYYRRRPKVPKDLLDELQQTGKHEGPPRA